MPAAGSGVLKVGLTGGVASGKSTVAAALAAHGAAIQDADAVVARLYAPGSEWTRAIAAQLGAGVLGADGGINRQALGQLVLADPAARRWLEGVVHPAVRAALAAWLQDVQRAQPLCQVAVVEAALLVETGSWQQYDRLVVVSAPLALRRARARAKGWDVAVFEQLVAAQLVDEAKEAVADYVLRNDRGPQELAGAVATLWEHLLRDAATLAESRRLEPLRPPLRFG